MADHPLPDRQAIIRRLEQLTGDLKSARASVAVPDHIKLALQQLSRPSAETLALSNLFREIRAALDNPVPDAEEIDDLVNLLIESLDEKKRIAAAERLLTRYPSPIYTKRRAMVLPELRRRAAVRGVSIKAVLHDVALAALWQVVDTCGDLTPAELPEIRKKIRSGLNAVMTADLAGSDWRQRRRIISLDHAPEGTTNPAAEIEARLAVESLVASAHLSSRETAVVAAVSEGKTLAEAGRALGVKESTARVLFWRARRKLVGV